MKKFKITYKNTDLAGPETIEAFKFAMKDYDTAIFVDENGEPLAFISNIAFIVVE